MVIFTYIFSLGSYYILLLSKCDELLHCVSVNEVTKKYECTMLVENGGVISACN